MRISILGFLLDKANISEGEMFPRWFQYVSAALFPIKTYLSNNKTLSYIPHTDTYFIRGVGISGDFIKAMKGRKEGAKFEITQPSWEGPMQIRELTD